MILKAWAGEKRCEKRMYTPMFSLVALASDNKHNYTSIYYKAKMEKNQPKQQKSMETEASFCTVI